MAIKFCVFLFFGNKVCIFVPIRLYIDVYIKGYWWQNILPRNKLFVGHILMPFIDISTNNIHWHGLLFRQLCLFFNNVGQIFKIYILCLRVLTRNCSNNWQIKNPNCHIFLLYLIACLCNTQKKFSFTYT